MLRHFFIISALAVMTMSAQAKVKLPHVLGNKMILQQNTEARLWGWDKPGKTVSVSVSWSSDKYSAKTGKDGKWLVVSLTFYKYYNKNFCFLQIFFISGL